ncbi:hypothetical protein ACIOWK_33125 [Pseudomonas protegens]|uniref:hypothetical protein n=1 Tax=Pseudomonas protegens TaxID=380021 RepID=UPI00380D2249
MNFLLVKSLFVYLLTLVIVVAGAAVVLFGNLESDLYPANQDAVLIPFFDIFCLFLILLVFVITQALLYRRGGFFDSTPIINFFQVIIFLVTVFALVGSTLYWAKPGYLPIGVGYGLSLLVYFLYIFSKLSVKKI